MQSFLSNVAQRIFADHGAALERVAIVFPNRRTSLFFNEELARCLKDEVWLTPRYYTISELFHEQSPRTVMHPIEAVGTLYDLFQTDTLDSFWTWGEVMLKDFDDIDKHLARADYVLKLVGEWHAGDNVDHIDEEQWQELQRFFGEKYLERSRLQRRFREFWDRLLHLYNGLQARCRELDVFPYEGALQRYVVEHAADCLWTCDKYYFVGFNQMNPVEEKLMHMLPASQRIDDDDLALDVPQTVDIASAATENIQARYVHDWLLAPGRLAEPERTAIVLGDESLMRSVVQYLPTQDANVTLGYPLSQTLVNTFVKHYARVQLYGPLYKMVTALRNHPYAGFFKEDDDALLRLPEGKSLLTRLLDMVAVIGRGLPEDDALGRESAFKMFEVLQELIRAGLDKRQLSATTMMRILDQVVLSATIPFSGEPLRGVQVMGMLETRNLHFDHVLVLSCNEGNVPRGVTDVSLIPHIVRQGYKLSTPNQRVALYKYYFDRLVCRCPDVTLVYNSSTEDGHTGQMSRFILQLMLRAAETRTITVRNINLVADQHPVQLLNLPVAKDASVMDQLRSLTQMSPSSLNVYLQCHKKFYMQKVCGLKEPDAETLDDPRVTGTVFHDTMQAIYSSLVPKDAQGHTILPATITAPMLDPFLNDPARIDPYYQAALQKQKTGRHANKALVIDDGMHLTLREMVRGWARNQLEADRRLTPFRIHLMEEWRDRDFTFTFGPDNESKTLRMGGFIDRLDEVDGRLRVADYKTGKPADKHPNDVKDIFADVPKGDDKHRGYYLQTFFYALFVRHSTKLNPHDLPVVPALLFSKFRDSLNDPVLRLGKNVIRDIDTYRDYYDEHLGVLLADIYDPTTPFHPNVDACAPYNGQRCAFYTLCHQRRKDENDVPETK